VVSVLRVIGEFERIGDLALRVAKLAPQHHLLTADAAAHDILAVMADAAVERFRMAVRAWATLDDDLAVDLVCAPAELDLAMEHLTRRVHALVGPDAAEQAVALSSAARAVDRISDHTVVLGARVRYLVTGDPAHLAVEVR
jgi:phosphate transport system protein